MTSSISRDSLFASIERTTDDSDSSSTPSIAASPDCSLLGVGPFEGAQEVRCLGDASSSSRDDLLRLRRRRGTRIRIAQRLVQKLERKIGKSLLENRKVVAKRGDLVSGHGQLEWTIDTSRTSSSPSAY